MCVVVYLIGLLFFCSAGFGLHYGFTCNWNYATWPCQCYILIANNLQMVNLSLYLPKLPRRSPRLHRTDAGNAGPSTAVSEAFEFVVN